MAKKTIHILSIESSCDDTGAAILANDKVLSNVVANQEIHTKYGGVVPELASRAHQQNIVPVVSQALTKAKVKLKDLDAIAFTKGPGLLGSLLVGIFCGFCRWPPCLLADKKTGRKYSGQWSAVSGQIFL